MFYNYDGIYKYIYILTRSLQNIKILLFAFAAQHAFNVIYLTMVPLAVCCVKLSSLFYMPVSEAQCTSLQEHRSPHGKLFTFKRNAPCVCHHPCENEFQRR